MGLFKKKPDPISERALALNDQIAALEAQIQKLSVEQSQPPAPSPFSPASSAMHAGQSSQPRLRSTALPHGPTISATAAPREPVFEAVDHVAIQDTSANGPRLAPPADLGTRRFDWSSSWERFKNHFRGPSTSNPKLVNYLAAGSIQGLRPLRYEKRVARNRFIVLVVFLALVLWGVLAIFFRNR